MKIDGERSRQGVWDGRMDEKRGVIHSVDGVEVVTEYLGHVVPQFNHHLQEQHILLHLGENS